MARSEDRASLVIAVMAGGAVPPSSDLAQGDHTESPLPLWERDRGRGSAPAGAEESVDRRYSPELEVRYLRAAARVPSPCPSPTRGEGTLRDGPASDRCRVRPCAFCAL